MKKYFIHSLYILMFVIKYLFGTFGKVKILKCQERAKLKFSEYSFSSRDPVFLRINNDIIFGEKSRIWEKYK